MVNGEVNRKAIVVTLDVNSAGKKRNETYVGEALEELNQHLAEGWMVVHSLPMSGTEHSLYSASVVILEKRS